jgi:hypothetical protein
VERCPKCSSEKVTFGVFDSEDSFNFFSANWKNPTLL